MRPLRVCPPLLTRRSAAQALRLRIEGHTGTGMPALLAPALSERRADMTKRELLAFGAEASQIDARGWGNRVAFAAGWSATEVSGSSIKVAKSAGSSPLHHLQHSPK